MTGQRVGKEKEDTFLLGNRLRPPESHAGPGKSQRRARGVLTEEEERTQERNQPQGGRKLPSFEEKRPAEYNGKRLSEGPT